MNCFDNVIGYDKIKEELTQICDMIRNREFYEGLGAKMPSGILLYGDPGLGKTLLANAFMTESGLPLYTVGMLDGKDDLVKVIADAFKLARDNAPAIVFLDDMDKLANEDERHRDAKEYVAIQAAIDGVKGKNVLVVATANDVDKLPESLIRDGRFDHKIEVEAPNGEDARKIIEYYLSSKKVGESVNMEDLCMMISYHSCAELETILNEAAIQAGRNRHKTIEMGDLVKTVLRMNFHTDQNYENTSEEEVRKVALHEAGHLTICEVIAPGSVGIATLTVNDDSVAGTVRRCKELKRRPYEILVTLGGKVATELYYSEACASGCQRDLDMAVANIWSGIVHSGTHGVGLVDPTPSRAEPSDAYKNDVERCVHSALERYIFKARNILLKNRDFLEKVTEALIEKKTLLYSDIRAIRESVALVPAVV
ncbi:AAA family ATPase [bacterium]|nr:AAA family ATPase [bacterium]